MSFDVELLGDCDIIVNELCHRLGSEWTQICTLPPLEEKAVAGEEPDAAGEEHAAVAGPSSSSSTEKEIETGTGEPTTNEHEAKEAANNHVDPEAGCGDPGCSGAAGDEASSEERDDLQAMVPDSGKPTESEVVTGDSKCQHDATEPQKLNRASGKQEAENADCSVKGAPADPMLR